MKLEKIAIRNFRGIRELDHSLNANSIVIYGENGTGKSSLFQALYFGLFGEYAPLTSVDTPAEFKRYRHVGADQELSSVRLDFSTAGAKCWIERTLDHNGQVSTNYSSQNVLSLVQDIGGDFSFLTRRRFNEMIETVEQERWKKLSPLIGHHKIAQFRSGLNGLKNNLKRDLNIGLLESSISKLDRKIDTLSEQSKVLQQKHNLGQVGSQDISTELKGLLNLFSIPKTGDDIDWNGILRQIPGSQKAVKLTKEKDNLADFKALCGLPRAACNQDKETAYEFLRKIAAHGDEIQRKIVWSRFYVSSFEIVSTLADQVCPLCKIGKPNWAQIAPDLAARKQESASLNHEFTVAARYFQEARNLGSSFQDSLTRAQDLNLLSDKLAETSTAFATVGAFLDRICIVLNDHKISEFGEAELDLFSRSRKRAAETYNELHKALRARVEEVTIELKKAGADSLQKVLDLKAIDEALATIAQLDKERMSVKQRLNITNAVIAEIFDFYRNVEDAETELTENALVSLEQSTQNIFQQITQNTKLKPVLEAKTVRNVRRVEFSIEDFYGLGTVSARDYLSEANRNALGLSVLFAGLLNNIGSKISILFLDDITHSADYSHRRLLSQFIADELSQKVQLVILTHDDKWYDRLLSGLGCSGLKILDWTIDGIKLHCQSWKPLFEIARDKILVQKHLGGNELRQSTEMFVDQLCEKMRIQVPFKQNPSDLSFNIKREALHKEIESLWNDNQKGVIDSNSPAFRTAKLSQKITNLASHGTTYNSWSNQDLVDTFNDGESWFDLFKCKNPHGNSVCGQLLPNLSKKNGVMPICKRCGQAFCP